MGNIEIQKGRGQYDGFAKTVKTGLPTEERGEIGDWSLAISAITNSQ